MNFSEAREKARLGFHVRREGWSDKWFALWRGLWWCMGAAYSRVVQATDYGTDDFTASDWTTIPAALAGCPPPPPPPPPPGGGGGGGGSGGSGGGSNGGGSSGGGGGSGGGNGGGSGGSGGGSGGPGPGP